MKAKGNGDIRTCVSNLLRTWRGEVPYERLKGMDTRNVDRPTSTVRSDVQQDARWLVETYEPRADIQNITAEQTSDHEGGLLVTVDITGGGEATNG